MASKMYLINRYDIVIYFIWSIGSYRLEFLENEAGAQELMSPLSTVFYESEDNDEKNDY